jgi:hypothetical protein
MSADDAERLAGPLADDPAWEVREWVVDPLVDFAAQGAWNWVDRWVEREGGRRRAAVVATRFLLGRGAVSCDRAVEVARRVVDDPDRYVAASVGTFLLADGIAPRCPDAFAALAATLLAGPAPATSPRWRHLLAVARRDAGWANRLASLAAARPSPGAQWLRRRLEAGARRGPQVDAQRDPHGQ